MDKSYIFWLFFKNTSKSENVLVHAVLYTDKHDEQAYRDIDHYQSK